jgi:serine protease AprX
MDGTGLNNRARNGDGLLRSTTWGTRLACLALVTLLAAGLALANGNHHKLSKELEALKGGDGGATVDVIIQFNQTPTAAHHQKVQNKGGILKRTLSIVKGAHYSIPVTALEALANDPDVAFISPNRPVNGALDHVVRAVNADIALAQGWDGTGVSIAVVDSGVGLHDDLYTDRGTVAPRVVYSQSFVPGDTSTADAYGHGTHVAGIISSNGTDSMQKSYPGVYRGIAPEADIVNLRVLDADGSGSDSSVIAAIQQAIALQNTYNIRVLNLSLGRPVYESYTLDPLCQAVEAAWNAGIVVVVAAGNSGRDTSLGTQGYATIGAPGNDPYVITVGATNLHGSFSQSSQTITSYSSKGPTLIDHVVKPDLAAPGNRVVSLLAPDSTLVGTYPSLDMYPCNSTATQCNGSYGAAQYFRLSGTSMATPVVSGVAALLLQQNPSLTPDQVKARLMKTAWKGYGHYISETDSYGINHSLQHDVFAIGAGFVDAEAAVSDTDLAPATLGSAKSPMVHYDPLTGTVYLVADPNSVWNSSVVWGTSVVWGASIFNGTTVEGYSVVWGRSVVWGSTLNQGFSVVWGDSVVWGASLSQAFSAGDDGDQ